MDRCPRWKGDKFCLKNCFLQAARPDQAILPAGVPLWRNATAEEKDKRTDSQGDIMAPTFFRLKLDVLDHPIMINANQIRAIQKIEQASDKKAARYIVWLTEGLKVSSEFAKRIAALAGATPLKKEMWEVESKDLDALF